MNSTVGRKVWTVFITVVMLASVFSTIDVLGSKASATGESSVDSVNKITGNPVVEYLVFGSIVNQHGTPISPAIIVALDMSNENAMQVYAENGVYSLNIGDIGGVMYGDVIRIIGSNGLWRAYEEFVLETGTTEKRIDLVLDTESDRLPGTENALNPLSDFGYPEFPPGTLAAPDISALNSTVFNTTIPELKLDLKILDISFSDEKPVQGDVVRLTATVSTNSPLVELLNVTFYLDQMDNEHYIASKREEY